WNRRCEPNRVPRKTTNGAWKCCDSRSSKCRERVTPEMRRPRGKEAVMSEPTRPETATRPLRALLAAALCHQGDERPLDTDRLPPLTEEEQAALRAVDLAALGQRTRKDKITPGDSSPALSTAVPGDIEAPAGCEVDL